MCISADYFAEDKSYPQKVLGITHSVKSLYIMLAIPNDGVVTAIIECRYDDQLIDTVTEL
jgi:hypothetical protein